MQQPETDTFCPADRPAWRQWLAENHASKQSVWLIYHKVKSGRRSLSWSDAVDEALCFGWIDSTAKALDEHTYMQFFCRRKPNSVWSKINKTKVERLTEEGLMAPASCLSVEIARQNGSWTILDEVEELIIPMDLEQEFTLYAGSMDFFMGLSNSVRKSILQWLVLAKRAETRQKRMSEIAELAGQKLKPKQFR